MNKLTRISATVASSVALVAGFAGAASASSIHGSGDDSSNRIRSRSFTRTTTHNQNNIDVKNNNPQYAHSGDVRVDNNDDVSDATSGTASNDSWTEANVTVDNSSNNSSNNNFGGSGWDGGSIDNTDNDSRNRIDRSTTNISDVRNDNKIHVENNNTQSARSGSVNVDHNDDVGSVTSGDATNTSTSTFDVNVTNE